MVAIHVGAPSDAGRFRRAGTQVRIWGAAAATACALILAAPAFEAAPAKAQDFMGIGRAILGGGGGYYHNGGYGRHGGRSRSRHGRSKSKDLDESASSSDSKPRTGSQSSSSSNSNSSSSSSAGSGSGSEGRGSGPQTRGPDYTPSR